MFFGITVKLEWRRCFIYRSCDLAIIQCLEINSYIPSTPKNLTEITPATRLHFKPPNLKPVADRRFFERSNRKRFAFYLTLDCPIAQGIVFLVRVICSAGKTFHLCFRNMREIIPNYSIIDAEQGYI